MGQGHCFVFFCKTFSLYSYKTLERYLLTDDFDTIKFSYLILTYVDLLYKTFQDNLQCTEHPFQGGVTICPVALYNFIGTLLIFNGLQPIPRDSNGKGLAAMLDEKVH